MIAALKDPDPVVFIDDRWLYGLQEDVPEELYEVEIGKAVIRKTGLDITLAACSHMAHASSTAARQLIKEQIDVEFIDLRTVKPLDHTLLLASVKKTGRLVVADGGWRTGGLAAEITAMVCENAFDYLKAPIRRVTLPDSPAPASRTLEKAYYPDAQSIADAVREVMEYKRNFKF